MPGGQAEYGPTSILKQFGRQVQLAILGKLGTSALQEGLLASCKSHLLSGS